MTRVIDTREPLRKQPMPRKRKKRSDGAGLSPRSLLRALVALTLASALLLMALNWEIGTIRVRNASVTPLDGVAEVLRPYLGSPLLLADRSAMARSLCEDPWVRDVAVKLRPPSTVLLDVEEAQPMLRLGDGRAVDAEGVLLPAREGLDLSALPLLRIREWNESTREQIRAWSQAQRELPYFAGATLRELRIDAAGLRLLLADGVEVDLGRERHRERLARLEIARQQLSPKPGDRLDLRFSRQIVLSHQGG